MTTQAPEFTIYLPPGWSQVDLTDDVEASLGRLTASIVRSVPLTRQPAVRRLVEQQVLPGLRELATGNVVCVLTPTLPSPTDPVRPTVTITHWPSANEQDDTFDPLAMLQVIAQSNPTASIIDLDGMVAMRTESSVDMAEPSVRVAQAAYDQALADPAVGAVTLDLEALLDADEHDLRLLSKRVLYYLGVPGDPTHWVTIQCSAQYASTRDAAALAAETVDLFDAIVSTFRWQS